MRNRYTLQFCDKGRRLGSRVQSCRNDLYCTWKLFDLLETKGLVVLADDEGDIRYFLQLDKKRSLFREIEKRHYRNIQNGIKKIREKEAQKKRLQNPSRAKKEGETPALAPRTTEGPDRRKEVFVPQREPMPTGKSRKPRRLRRPHLPHVPNVLTEAMASELDQFGLIEPDHPRAEGLLSRNIFEMSIYYLFNSLIPLTSFLRHELTKLKENGDINDHIRVRMNGIVMDFVIDWASGITYPEVPSREFAEILSGHPLIGDEIPCGMVFEMRIDTTVNGCLLVVEPKQSENPKRISGKLLELDENGNVIWTDKEIETSIIMNPPAFWFGKNYFQKHDLVVEQALRSKGFRDLIALVMLDELEATNHFVSWREILNNVFLKRMCTARTVIGILYAYSKRTFWFRDSAWHFQHSDCEFMMEQVVRERERKSGRNTDEVPKKSLDAAITAEQATCDRKNKTETATGNGKIDKPREVKEKIQSNPDPKDPLEKPEPKEPIIVDPFAVPHLPPGGREVADPKQGQAAQEGEGKDQSCERSVSKKSLGKRLREMIMHLGTKIVAFVRRLL